MIEGAQARDVLRLPNPKYVRPTDGCHQDPQYRKWRDLVKGRKIEETAVVCVDTAEGAETVWLRTAAVKAAQASGFLKPKPKGTDASSAPPAPKMAVQTRALQVAVERMANAARLADDASTVLRCLTMTVLGAWSPAEIKEGLGMSEAGAAELVANATPAELRALAIRIACRTEWGVPYIAPGVPELLGVDMQDCTREAEELVALERAAAKANKRSKTKSAAAGEEE